MKIKGQEVKGLNRRLIVIPRDNGREDITLWAQAIPNFDRFNQLCPAPLPPAVLKKGGVKEYDFNDSDYKRKSTEQNAKLSAYIVLASLDLPENELAWDTVNIDDHTTWLNYITELQEAGFTDVEVAQITRECGIVNCLNENHVEAARQLFLNRLAAQE